MTTEAPKPGIYKDVPFATYLAWPCVSNSRINQARRSLLHFKEDQSTEPTKALRLGQFIHCGVLEPLAISMRYAVMPPYQDDPANKTKDGKPSKSRATEFYAMKARLFAEANNGKQIIEQSDYDILLGVSKSLYRSKRAREFLSEPGESEVSVVWNDVETGLLCKARFDLENSCHNDLKTCRDAASFPKSIATYGYHRQAAHYQTGYATITGEVKPFNIIAVETTRPFGVRAAPMNEDAIEVGAEEIAQAMRAIANAYDKDEWPGYDDPSSWCLPSYYGSGESIELVVDGQTVTI
jgi:exodeoxyribonuclease VIII